MISSDECFEQEKVNFYYRFEGDYVIFVISGGDKDSQDRDIRKAKKGK